MLVLEGESLFGIRTQKVEHKSPDKLQDDNIKKISANFEKMMVREVKEDYPEVESFLKSVNLERHKDLFIANGFEDIDSILELKDEHFQFMQLPLGHKLKILKRVRELRKEALLDVEQEISDVEQKTTEAQVTKEENKELVDGTYNEEESHKEFLKAREAWLKGRQATKETKGGFLVEVGDNAWNVPSLPEYTEEGTNVSPKEAKKDVKDCCFGCFKFFDKGKGFEDKEIHKTFCSDRCFKKYFEEYAVNCVKCNKKLLCEKAIFKDNMYFCSETCYETSNKPVNEKSEAVNTDIDEMFQLENLN